MCCLWHLESSTQCPESGTKTSHLLLTYKTTSEDRAFHRAKHHCWAAPSPTAHCSESMWARGMGLPGEYEPHTYGQADGLAGNPAGFSSLCSPFRSSAGGLWHYLTEKSPAFLQKAIKTKEPLYIRSAAQARDHWPLARELSLPYKAPSSPEPPIILPL